ncbi:MAG: HutD family protein [Rubrivivax sp.]|nr:HutD family protein [Rubrivivax sp.]
MTLLPCDRVAPTPWKNGGGLTRELLAWPSPTREGSDWALRISVADIRADGPFSAFAGVDRWFAVLEGAGVQLGLPAGPHKLQAGDAPLAFPGEAAPGCTLLDGPTRDLNLMLRRGAGRGAMQAARVGEDFAPRARFRALFAADALQLQVDGADAMPVPAFALAWDAQAHGRWRIAATRPVRAWWLHFEPHA